MSATAQSASLAEPTRGAAARAHHCVRSDLHTVVQNARARILREDDRFTGDRGLPTDAYFGCLFASGRLLTLAGGDDVLYRINLRGRFVAFFDYFDDGAPHCEQGLEVVVRDLSRSNDGFAHETFRDYDPRQPNCPKHSIPAAPVRIVLKANGAVAWTRCTWKADGAGFAGAPLSCGRDPLYEVVLHDARGNRRRGRIIDAGASIDPRSLLLHNGRIIWRHGGRLRSARLR